MRTAMKFERAWRHPVLDRPDPDRADDMAIAVRLEDVGAPECGHPVLEHAARGRIDDRVAMAGLVALAAGDQVAAFLDEEIRPFFEPVLVDAFGIGGDQLVHALPNRGVVHRGGRQSPTSERYFFQKPRIAASLTRKGCDCAS